ncbi:Golgi transport complex subunit 5-domain-containing protein [Podospora conica]|nr:Golgi transport complex subunit 5-domain-containing protein [Schizothecium conicum]
MTTPNDDEPSYIDYEAFLDPSFSPAAFANTLVLATNNPSDSPLDLSTPLSRVLFDIQEVDSHIDVLTTRSALPLLTHTKRQNDASARIVAEIDTQITALNASYSQLEKDVLQKHAEADQVRNVAARLWETLRLARAVTRCLQLGRQLQVQHSELAPTARGAKEDHRALVRCTHTLLSLRELLASAGTPGSEGFGIDRVDAVRSLRDAIITPVVRSVRETAERIIREFSIGSPVTSTSATAQTQTFAQSEEARARTASALTTLYLLSPAAAKGDHRWTPTLMLEALKGYLQSAVKSSSAGLSRALASLPSLDRTLAEVSARCQNVVALEAVLEATKTPEAAPGAKATTTTMLQPLLAYLETGSLASYFWRDMAGSLATRVQEIAAKGGTAARTLRANRSTVEKAIRECVIKGSRLPSSISAGAGRGKGKAEGEKEGQWEREVAVMLGSLGAIGTPGR